MSSDSMERDLARATEEGLTLDEAASTTQIEVSSAASAREFIKVDVVGKDKNVGLITLNRPKALNALNQGLMSEVCF